MKEMVTLNKKEQRRLVVLNQVEMGKMIGREAAELLDLSLRHVRRILVAYRKEGAVDWHMAIGEGNLTMLWMPVWGSKYWNWHSQSMLAVTVSTSLNFWLNDKASHSPGPQYAAFSLRLG